MYLAHAGHWLEPLIYLVPLVLLVALFVWMSLSDRRKQNRDRDD